MKDKPDAAIAQIRQVRHRISEQLSHDPRQIIAYYMELQQQYAERLLFTEAEVLLDKSVAVSQLVNQPVFA